MEKRTKSDVIAAMTEWDARNAEQEKKHKAQYEVFRNKQNEIFDGIRDKVIVALSGVTLNFDVEVGSTGFATNNVYVSVKSNYDRVHAQDKALSWNFEVSLYENRGLNKKTSSWSGLQVTTDEQVESLYQTANALRILNDIDWAELLSVDLPVYSDYVTEKSSIGQRPDFEMELYAAELSTLVGTNTLVKGYFPEGNRKSEFWYLLVSETPKQYKVVEFSAHSITEKNLSNNGKTFEQVVNRKKIQPAGITKEKFIDRMLVIPIETMAF